VTSHEEAPWPLTLPQEIPNIHIFNWDINVNKGVFCLIISYLQIKSYNVLNYNNCSTGWPFHLRKIILKQCFAIQHILPTHSSHQKFRNMNTKPNA
jgi:hypothetical protein